MHLDMMFTHVKKGALTQTHTRAHTHTHTHARAHTHLKYTRMIRFMFAYNGTEDDNFFLIDVMDHHKAKVLYFVC